jgi:hypothetical protein
MMVGLCAQIKREVMIPVAWYTHVECKVVAMSCVGVERVVMMGCLRPEGLEFGLMDMEMEAQYQWLH